jgi:hypothetical protein
MLECTWEKAYETPQDLVQDLKLTKIEKKKILDALDTQNTPCSISKGKEVLVLSESDNCIIAMIFNYGPDFQQLERVLTGLSNRISAR